MTLRGIVRSQWTLGLAMALVMVVAGCGVAARLLPPGAPITPPLAADELAETLRSSRSSAIAEVVVDHDPWFDSPEVYVILVAGATDAHARDVWCTRILPTGVRWQTAMVTREIGSGEWLPPSDCHDPDDIPAYRTGPAT